MRALVIFLLFITVIVQAQDITVLKTDQLTSLKDGELIISAVSPDGKSVLVSSAGYKSLFVININLKNVLRISDQPGAGYEPCFSADGSTVFFRSDEFTGLRKYSSLLKYVLASGKTEIIETKSRDLTSPLLINNQLIYSVGGNQKKRLVAPDNLKSSEENIFVVLENLTPVLYVNGQRKPIKPCGEGNYIWVSLSPDKTKLLFNFQGKATYVSDLEGKIVSAAGRINAPKWLNNEIIVGMNDVDDGYRILSSDIICYSLITNQITNLTSTPLEAEMYPFPLAGKNKIVYQTLTGEIFLMSLSVK